MLVCSNPPGRTGEARLIAFGMLWMAVAIVPVLNFRLLPEGEIAHDRYLYLPMVGIAILVGVGWRQASRLGARFLGRPIGGLAAVGLLALILGFAALRQSLYWSDDLTLNFHAHLVAPHNVYATTSFAAAAAQSGREGAAMALYREALAARPDFWRANVNLAYLYYAHGNYREAAHYFQRACETDPTDGDQFLYLGDVIAPAGSDARGRVGVSVRRCWSGQTGKSIISVWGWF